MAPARTRKGLPEDAGVDSRAGHGPRGARGLVEETAAQMPRVASAHLCHLVSKLSRRSRESMIRVSHLQADRPNHVPICCVG